MIYSFVYINNTQGKKFNRQFSRLILNVRNQTATITSNKEFNNLI